MAKNRLFQTQSAIGTAKGSSGDAVADLQRFLQRFGYLHLPLSESDPLSKARDLAAPQFTLGTFEDATEAALRRYQEFYKLIATGVLDEATLAHMSQPRCGFPDNPARAGVADFAVISRWGTSLLTYNFQEFTGDLPEQDIRNAITGAFGLWSAVTPLRFLEARGRGDIAIRFVTGDHGDGNAFDGIGSVLAHAFPPQAGDVHFDDDETWTVDIPPTGTDLFTVAGHEIGHALGLDHSDVSGALMVAFYSGAHRFLAQDDIDGIQSVYGGPYGGPYGSSSFSIGLDHI